MHILGIDTSCDDTCIAIVEADKRRYQRRFTRIKFNILSNIISSQVKIHAKYGGVYPFLAKREHQRNLPIVLKKALREAGFEISNFQFLISKQIPNPKSQIPKIDFIAVTVGPGLEPCLWTGINFARDLAQKLNLPIVPVNHIEAHIFANWLMPISKCQMSNVECQIFPAVCLVVSGGHTQLILMKAIGKYKILGETRDDAAGECLDKTARILGIGYPGGPAIAEMASKFKVQSSKFKVKLPRPMINQKNYDFSFSGLKTAVLYKVKSEKLKVKSCEFKRVMAAEIQQAVIDVLIHKTLRAAKDYRARSIILGGGVAANDELRKQFQEACSKFHFEHLVPPKNLCTDNAAMIALTAFFHKEVIKDWQKIKANANLSI